jgi:hypothetical protein
VRTVVVFALIALCTAVLADTSASPPARAATLDRVTFHVTPGKPMQLGVAGEPAERIEVWRQSGKVLIQVTRNVGEVDQGRGPIEETDWKQIEAVIAAHKLTTWQARPSKDRPVYDYSYSGFTLYAGTKVINEQSWGQPVQQIGDPAALAHLLGELAKKNVARPTLFYF